MRIPRKLALTLSVALAALGLVPSPVAAGGPLACGDTLMTNTTLTSDLDCSATGSNGLNIGADNIVLNLGGYTIWGWTGDDSYIGVYSSYHVGVTIRHGKIRNFDEGIYADYGNTTTVKGLTIKGESGDASYGIYFSYMSKSTITKSKFDPAGVTAVYSEYGARNEYSWNHVSNADYGFYTEYENRDQFLYNVVEGTSGVTYGVYDYESASNVFLGNVTSGGYAGLYLYCDDSGWAVVIGNEASDNSYVGLYMYDCYDYYSPGMPGSYVANNLFLRNVDYGMYDDFSINSLFEHNVAKNNDDYGFYFDYPQGSVIRNNEADRNGSDGFYFDVYSAYFPRNVKNNIANRNDGSGLYSSGAVTSKNNSAHNNGDWDCFNVNC